MNNKVIPIIIILLGFLTLCGFWISLGNHAQVEVPISTTVIGTPVYTVSSSPNNPYTKDYYGECTWSSAEMRPDLDFIVANAYKWASIAKSHGYLVDNTPKVGDIAVWQPYVGGTGKFGHVAYVSQVGIGTIQVMEYNFTYNHKFDVRTVWLEPGISFIHSK